MSTRKYPSVVPPKEWILAMCPVGCLDGLLKTPVGIWVARYNANPSYEAFNKINNKCLECSPNVLGVSMDIYMDIIGVLGEIKSGFVNFIHDCNRIKEDVWIDDEEFAGILTGITEWEEFKKLLEEKGKLTPVIDLLELQCSVGRGIPTF